MKIWATKYALTTGIKEYDVEDCGNGMVKTPGSFSTGGGLYFHGEGVEWHRTLFNAKIHAETMRNKKIATLKKQMLKISKLKF
jgi:hypothetical protein